MRKPLRGVIAALLSLCVLGLLTMLPGRPWFSSSASRHWPGRVRPSPPRSHSEAALHEARRAWGQALLAVKPDLEALAEHDPEAASVQEDVRRSLVSRDESGHLRRARAAARQAAALAQTPREAYNAAVWLALLSCEAGDHQEELEHARKLVELQPRQKLSWLSLRRAARCNHLGALEQRAQAALTAPPQPSAPAPER